MQTKPSLHDQHLEVTKTFTRKLSALQADPFALLAAFVQGTGDLFDEVLLCRIHDICEKQDVKSYIELASEVDGYTKTYVSASPELVKGHRALCSLLKKYPFSACKSPYNPKQAAIEKWWAAEDQCKKTNDRLSLIANGDLPSFVFRARRLIEDALGELTPGRIMKILREGEHGKGTSTECPYVASTVYHKYQSTRLFCTKRAMNYAKAAISLNRRWYDHLDASGVRTRVPLPHSSKAFVEEQLLSDVISLNEPERISFVEKDAKTMRPIGIGNTLNMYMQLGVKRTMTACLKSVGVNLRDQGKNQEMAYYGSLFGSLDRGKHPWQYSTIDLASASDTVSIGLCRVLLPSDWFGFLSDLRHECGVIEGETVVYNKMSAMGNGFTFPLESLLFWAIARATAEIMDVDLDTKDLAIYGDDIICPYLIAPQLIENLQWAGFTVNTEKSFITGSFKESCGADYYQGINVRPFYLKRSLVRPKDLYHVANSILPRSLDENCRVAAGYRSMYRKIHATLTQLGPVLYRPLSDVIGNDTKGNRIYKDTDNGLAIPLSYLRTIRPSHFSIREKVELFNKKWFTRVPKKWRNAALTALIRCNLPYALSVCETASRESNIDETLRLAVSLEAASQQPGTSDFYDSFYERFCRTDNGETVITRKGNSKLTFRLQAIPSWDCNASKRLILSHPIWG
jgi:hypothetical protein